MLTGVFHALLFLAPALLLAIPLLGGRYVGEDLIAKLVERRRRSRRASASASSRRPVPPATWLARGTRLIASSLAKRPPPATLLPQN